MFSYVFKVPSFRVDGENRMPRSFSETVTPVPGVGNSYFNRAPEVIEVNLFSKLVQKCVGLCIDSNANEESNVNKMSIDVKNLQYFICRRFRKS